MASGQLSAQDSAYHANSKVKVEYSDPSSVYAQIAPELHARLPLRNLNWNSQSRPLRSIDSLFVELVPDRTSSLSRPTSSAGFDIQPGRRSESPTPQRERRHQIPGLRSTPYLKIYLLRCDDSDTYKTSARKLVREWIKTNNLSPAKNSRAGQENHDAFEWLIIHVAPVDGGAWPTKAQTSVLEKLRSDFNGSSKSATDHVAQIPFAGDFQVQGATADAVPAGSARDHFVQESNRAWDALLAKIKALILLSFDLRVRQYEEDIKERGAQRHLPGWNFCTFFMLKEGLSIGFESVGLLDDALMGYDELSVELLAAMRDQQEGEGGASLFRDHTKDLFDQAEAAQLGSEFSPRRSQANRLSTSFIETDYEKPYRELIMANNISVFDFRCYVFARQVSVLMRMAHSLTNNGPRDTSMLAETCRRALSFIASNGRTVRQDLRTSFKVPEDADEAMLKKRHIIIENIVASWTFSSAQQILRQTEDNSLLRDMESQPQEKKRFKSPAPSGSESLKAPESPKRSSSQTRPMSLPIQGDTFSEAGIVTQTQRINQRKTALLALASQRAKLYALALSTLKAVGERAGWDHNSSGLSSSIPEEMDDIDLDADTGTRTPTKTFASSKYFADSLPNESLKAAVASQPAFYTALEDLSWKTHDLYQYSEDENSVHTIIADIAALRFHVKDYSSAASYLHSLAPFYAQHEWSDLEVAVLDMYALCLKQLHRNEDYVRIALKLIGKLARHEFQRSLLKSLGGTITVRKGTRANLTDILSASELLQEPLVASIQEQLFDIRLSQQIHHLNGHDGFGLVLKFQHALPNAFEADAVELRLAGTNSTRGRELILSSSTALEIRPGQNTVPLSCGKMIPGQYLVASIEIRAKNVLFKHQVVPVEDSNLPMAARPASNPLDRTLTSQPLVVWPARAALTIAASPHPHIHLEQPRKIQLSVCAGDKAASSVKLQLRSGSAGLRLHTAEAKVMEDLGSITDTSEPGQIAIGDIAAHACVKISIPYQLDNDLKEISFRSDVSYRTSQGSFYYGDGHSFAVNLPLGVNVQDIFQKDALFCKFSITTSSVVPLRVMHCEVEGTRDFEASTPFQDTSGLAVFSKQPVSMVYKTTRTETSSEDQSDLQTRMLMHVSYRCLDEEVLRAVRSCLSTSLKATESLTPYLPLLVGHLETYLKEHLLRIDLSTIALLREYTVAPFAAVKWGSALLAVPDVDRLKLATWLENWHKEHKSIELNDTDDDTAAPLRQITIPVDVPAMQILATTSLSIDLSPGASPPHVGDPITATLIISHTRRWAQDTLAEDLKDAPLSLIYELDIPSETWLLGGPRRKVFMAADSEVHTFDLMLIPQRAGHLQLPGIEIRAELARQADEEAEELQCETHNESIAEAVLVVPGAGEVNVGMAFDDPAPGTERGRVVGSAWTTGLEGWEAVEAQ